MKLFCILLLLAIAAPAHALRCKGRLVQLGDHALQARKHCGEPYWIDTHGEWLISGERGPLERRVERKVEVWYYNFGSNRFLQRLVFRDDRLQHEESLGYGFDRPAKGCNPDTLIAGTSNGEIIARCGLPQSQSERYADQTERDGQGNARLRVQRQQEWVYDSGNSRGPRLLLLIDGRLAEVQRLD